MDASDVDVLAVVTHWPEVAHSVFVPHTDGEYRRLVALLDTLTDEVSEDEGHQLASLVEVLGVLIGQYEASYIPEFSDE